jgi:hypothetical protein
VYLENYKSHIEIQIKGSHVIYVPVRIVTKKPDVVILEKNLDFGEGVVGDDL